MQEIEKLFEEIMTKNFTNSEKDKEKKPHKDIKQRVPNNMNPKMPTLR